MLLALPWISPARTVAARRADLLGAAGEWLEVATEPYDYRCASSRSRPFT
ncbi:hypothetical protein [Streptosporangium sp. NPDC087985]